MPKLQMTLEELEQKLKSIESRRTLKNWEVKAPSRKSKLVTHGAILRAVALRGLEIPVGEWTDQFCASNPNPEITEILRTHIKDEEKHDSQLDYLAQYLGCVDIPPRAKELTERWLTLECHPLLKKMVLEAGVFFPILGMFAVYGKTDLYLQSVRQWVSADESAHVASSRLVIHYLRLQGEHITVPSELMELTRDTISWVCGGKDEARWQSASRSGLTDGRIIGGAEMTTVAVPDHFTQRANQEISYQNH